MNPKNTQTSFKQNRVSPPKSIGILNKMAESHERLRKMQFSREEAIFKVREKSRELL
jgi:hypothetical protein